MTPPPEPTLNPTAPGATSEVSYRPRRPKVERKPRVICAVRHWDGEHWRVARVFLAP